MNIRRLRFFFLLLPIIVGLTSCAGKKPRTNPQAPYNQAESAGTLSPDEPVSSSPLGETGWNGSPGEGEGTPRGGAKPPITLVVGGTGVASFATIGILKRFREEGIKVERIIATGWPALFALGYGLFKSIHDLEWFAMRLSEGDFKFSRGFFGGNSEKLSKFIQNSLPAKDLNDTKIPILIATGQTGESEPAIYERGEWTQALLQALNMPGVYRDFSETGKVRALAVDEGFRRGAKIVVAVSMYEDYFKFVGADLGKDAGKGSQVLEGLKKSLSQELGLAQVSGRVTLGRRPDALAAKRSAIQAGYKEATRLAKSLRNHVP